MGTEQREKGKFRLKSLDKARGTKEGERKVCAQERGADPKESQERSIAKQSVDERRSRAKCEGSRTRNRHR